MRTTNQKALDYLESNPIVNNWINMVNTERKDYYVKADMPNQYKPLVVEIGNKFIRLWADGSCWVFISRVAGYL